jgi:hypothetical protein
MMSVEEKLRDNLKAAADALVVPAPKPALMPRPAGWRRGPVFALGGAAAVLALALPALLLWSGGGSSTELATPGTGPDTLVDSTDVPGTSAPTTTSPTPTSTTVLEDPDVSGTTVSLDELTFNDHTFALGAVLVAEEEPQTATVVLQVTPFGMTEPSDEIVVGSTAAFFWHTVTGEGGICEFSADQVDDGVEVNVQIFLSPSLGCSETYGFTVDGDDLTPDIETPEGVARQFVFSWVAGDEETMTDLADPTALSQARELSTPAEPVYSYCEGAAGSVYCIFEVENGELVVRVTNDQPARVVELISLPEE